MNPSLCCHSESYELSSPLITMFMYNTKVGVAQFSFYKWFEAKRYMCFSCSLHVVVKQRQEIRGIMAFDVKLRGKGAFDLRFLALLYSPSQGQGRILKGFSYMLSNFK